ncbi:MAG: tetratricopeptide repeat protein [Methylobacter sp.]|nr:tetratricopeptide repeat protein [Methylobacter sp.]
MAEYAALAGIGAAAKYNPHLWGAEELRNIFVARQNELAQIQQALRNTSPNTVPQHLLITGQRGMGKTTLLQRTALAVEDDEALNKLWVPLRFPEEQYTVSTTGEFWLNVLSALADALERQGLPTDEMDAQLLQITNLPGEQREELTLGLIKQWCQSAQKRLVLLIDSTDLLFANLAGGEPSSKASKNAGATALWRLRKILSHTPEFFWIGGSYQALESTNLYGDAFFDFFQLIELRPLNVIEMQDILKALASTFGAGRQLKGDAAEAEMMRVLNAYPERLRAMRQLTGGNPRTTIMLYELFAAGGDDNVRSDLERLLDILTPLYKARLETLADQPRKIMAYILECWAPVTANKLAEISNLAVTSVSAQLSRLEQDGFIEKVKMPGTKRKGYQASERFFNIWYLMRNAPRSLRLRLTWLVEFMRLWYSPDELHGLAMERMNNHRIGRQCSSSDLEYSRAVAFALPPSSASCKQLDSSVYFAAKREGLESELFDLEGEDHDYEIQEEYLVKEEDCRRVIDQCPNDAVQWNALGGLHYHLARYEEAEQAYRQAIALAPKNINSWNNLGKLLQYRLARYEEAEQAYRQAIAIDPSQANPWNNLANLLQYRLARYEEAEQAYRQAIAIDPSQANPWNNLGNLLQYRLARYEEAEQAYRQAIAIDPSQANLWKNLGILLKDQARYEEAEQAYRQAININPKDASLWHLGYLFYELGRYEEAEWAFRQTITLDPKDASSWNNWGYLLQNYLDRYEEAEQAYRQAIALDPRFAYPTSNLARLLAQQGKKTEADVYFRRSLELTGSEDYYLLLRAHCWLGNQDLAMQTLNLLAKDASAGDISTFFRLKELARECYALGLSNFLTDLMNASPYADFLQPFSLALKTASGDADALLGVVAEIRVMAEEVLQFISATVN